VTPNHNEKSADQPAWPQLALQIKSGDADSLEEALFASGALSVIYQDLHDQPILEPQPGEIRLWDDIRIIGLYPQESGVADVLSSLSQILEGDLPQHQWIPLPDQQWERAWMADFKPMQFGPTLWICPSHCEPVDPTATNIQLDPGLAFGTGAHATTRQCLQWLGQHSVAQSTVVDYGCGSGLLAIAAAMLGASEVTAVDIDPQALLATKNNALLNKVDATLNIGQPDIIAEREVDLVLANILYQPLIELAPKLAALVRPGGDLVISGILHDQIDSLQLRYNQWFSMRTCGQLDDWACMHATRNEMR